jgi:hypothetical protein
MINSEDDFKGIEIYLFLYNKTPLKNGIYIEVIKLSN